MRVLLTHDGLAYELTPVNKRIARDYWKATGHESVYIQSDWDRVPLAQTLGWNMARTRKCAHRGTDGTVKCPDCGRGASFFIEKATEWLDKRVDSVIQVRDCSYFDV